MQPYFSTEKAGWSARLGVLRSFRFVAAMLLIVIIVMIAVWQPWQPVIHTTGGTISVTGTASITATPDLYTFTPTYDFTNKDKQTALNQLSAKSNDLIAGLKALGVAPTDIRSNANGYSNYGYYRPVYMGDSNYNLNLTIVVHTAVLAQKVEDYLVGTSPSGQVTPEVTFSTKLQQQLQSQARDKAEKNARTQADQSARNLGFTVSSVKSVVDGVLNGGGPVMQRQLSAGSALNTTTPQLSVQPGQSDLFYSVQVIYYIK